MIGATLPLACVLSIAESGSEMNGGMVLTSEVSARKLGIGNKRLQPVVSILDPSVTCTVPPDHTAFGAVDVMAHVLEFYCNAEASRSPVQDRLLEAVSHHPGGDRRRGSGYSQGCRKRHDACQAVALA